MKGRAYVMIFFFWALLTIVTPMLVSWSQSLKTLPQTSDHQEDKVMENRARRMMGYSVEMQMHLARESLKRPEEEEMMMMMMMMEPSMAPRPEDKPLVPPKSFIVRTKQEEGSVRKDVNPLSFQ